MRNLLLAALSLAAALPCAAADFMSGPQMRDLLSGATIRHQNPVTGFAVTLRVHPDGTIESRGGPMGNMEDRGQWWIAGGKGRPVFCFHFPVAGLGRTPCFALVRSGDELIRYLPNGRKAPGINFILVR